VAARRLFVGGQYIDRSSPGAPSGLRLFDVSVTGAYRARAGVQVTLPGGRHIGYLQREAVFR
jgi:hypothetical protein